MILQYPSAEITVTQSIPQILHEQKDTKSYILSHISFFNYLTTDDPILFSRCTQLPSLHLLSAHTVYNNTFVSNFQ